MSRIFTLRSTHSASVDALRPDQATALVQILGVCLFVVATAIGAQVRIHLWEVPITLQTLFVYGSGLVLGARNGLLSMLLYLGLGMFLPVFASGSYGPAYLFSAISAGYLLGMPLAAVTIGTLSRRWNSFTGSLLSTFGGSFVLFACGVIWLHYSAGHVSWWQSLDVGWLRFIGFDTAKVLLVALSYGGVRRFF